jgi:succinyl-CoA synthetase beta subunit
MVSAGGIDIEEVAAKTPGEDPQAAGGSALRPPAASGAALGFSAVRDWEQVAPPRRSCSSSTSVFMANGCSLAEINPLVTTPDGKVLALDAKI